MQANTLAEPAEVLSGLLPGDELRKIDAYWRAANYRSGGPIYLLDDPLFNRPLTLQHLDRFHLTGDAIDRVPRLRSIAGYPKQFLRDRLIEHKLYVSRHGDDMPELRDWKWLAA